MKHAKLVAVCAKWLARANPVVVTEFAMMGGEQPDVLGFAASGDTALIECKVSRADFLADSDKEFRDGFDGIGNYRYYAAPVGMILVDELPLGWGLLEVHGSAVRVAALPHMVGANEYRERQILLGLIRRLSDGKERGANIRVIKASGKEKASLMVAEDE